jgi:hypothetical protein
VCLATSAGQMPGAPRPARQIAARPAPMQAQRAECTAPSHASEPTAFCTGRNNKISRLRRKILENAKLNPLRYARGRGCQRAGSAVPPGSVFDRGDGRRFRGVWRGPQCADPCGPAQGCGATRTRDHDGEEEKGCREGKLCQSIRGTGGAAGGFISPSPPRARGRAAQQCSLAGLVGKLRKGLCGTCRLTHWRTGWSRQRRPTSRRYTGSCRRPTTQTSTRSQVPRSALSKSARRTPFWVTMRSGMLLIRV